MFMMVVGTHFLCLRLFISALYHETQKVLIDAAQEGDPFISSFFLGMNFCSSRILILLVSLPYLSMLKHICVAASIFEK